MEGERKARVYFFSSFYDTKYKYFFYYDKSTIIEKLNASDNDLNCKSTFSSLRHIKEFLRTQEAMALSTHAHLALHLVKTNLDNHPCTRKPLKQSPTTNH